jgi:hypothetical protein
VKGRGKKREGEERKKTAEGEEGWDNAHERQTQKLEWKERATGMDGERGRRNRAEADSRKETGQEEKADTERQREDRGEKSKGRSGKKLGTGHKK